MVRNELFLHRLKRGQIPQRVKLHLTIQLADISLSQVRKYLTHNSAVVMSDSILWVPAVISTSCLSTQVGGHEN